MALRALKERKAGKEYRCSNCGDVIPKGTQYRYWEMGFRPSYKRIVCMKGTCTPKASQRETSNVAEAYAAQESAEEALDALAGEPPAFSDWATGVSAVRECVTTAAEEIRGVADTYREADEAFGGQGATESAERADTLEAAADELDSYDPSPEEPDGCGEHDQGDDLMEGCAACENSVADWWAGLISDARDAVSGVELP